MLKSYGMSAVSSAALTSLEAAIRACASQLAVHGFSPAEAAAGMHMANELRVLFLPLSRSRHRISASSVGLPPRRLRGGARRVVSVVGPTAGPVALAGDPLALGTPNSAFRQPPRRELVVARAHEKVTPVTPRASLRSAALKAWVESSPSAEVQLKPIGAVRKESATTPAPGLVVRLVHARASTAQRAHTGSDRVVTPARRSTRKSTEGLDIHSGRGASGRTHELLDATDYAYAPNVALLGARMPRKQFHSVSA
jgi:hypothetical protein